MPLRAVLALAAREGHRLQLVDIAARFKGKLGDRGNEAAELIIAGHEIGLGVDFDDSAGGAGG